MAATRSIDYGRWTKVGFLGGVVLFAVGVLGNVALSTIGGSAPAWAGTVFFDFEILGVLVGLLVPLVFGIVLPLIE